MLRREISKHREIKSCRRSWLWCGRSAGEAAGLMLMQGRTEPLDKLVIVDAGMPRVRFDRFHKAANPFS